MLGYAALAVLLCAGGSGAEADSHVPLGGDTVAVLATAFRYHFIDEKLDSLAINVEIYPGQGPQALAERLLGETAAELGLPTARISEILGCSEEITYPRRCELKGLKHLVVFRLSEFAEDRAVVWVTTWSEWKQGRVEGAGTQYELRRSTEGWVVVEALLHSAT